MWGPLNANAAIVFDRAEGSEVILVGRSKGYVAMIHYECMETAD